MKKIIAIIVIIIIAVLLWQKRDVVQAPSIVPETSEMATSSGGSYLLPGTVSDIASGAFRYGEYSVTGYVRSAYVCPPCPEGALCKMCMRNNIIITDGPDEPVTPEMSLIIFTDDPSVFRIGVPYHFSVRIGTEKTTDRPVNDVELVSADPVGE